jgi:hypothetical protein
MRRGRDAISLFHAPRDPRNPMHVTPRLLCLVGLVAIRAIPAAAGPFDDLRIRWDNTVTFSTEYGLHNALPAAANYCALDARQSLANDSDGGGCAYGAGFHTARIDLLSQIDIDAADFGLHASAAGLYDGIDNDDGGAGKNTAFDTATASENGGHDLELFEAFIHGVTDLGKDHPLSFRIGRHSIVWGESLFFPSNGIAAGLSPVDSYMARSPSDYRARDAYLPVDQLSLSWSATSELSLQAYYQFEWRRSRIDPNYADVDPNNVLAVDSTHLISLSVPGRGTVYYRRTADRLPDSTDQYGLALKWHRGDFDIGLYGLSYDAKTPNIDYYPKLTAYGYAAPVGAYSLEYPTGIEVYGASLAGPLGDAVFGAEISGRRNMPLVNGGVFIPTLADRHIAYGDSGRFPLGDTLHGQFSWIYTVPPVPGLPDGASWRGEIAANHLVQATDNSDRLAAGRTRTAAAIRTIFEPQFFQVLPRVDITLPVGVGYNFLGLSETDPAMNRGTGDIDFGITATIDQAWKGAVTFTHYFGQSKFPLVGLGGPQQPLGNWDYLQISVERSF